MLKWLHYRLERYCVVYCFEHSYLKRLGKIVPETRWGSWKFKKIARLEKKLRDYLYPIKG